MPATRRHPRSRLLAAPLGLALTLAAGMAASAPIDLAPARPRIGLVLGGGGAKGAAHIGVLRVLDELHIPVDCVAGTSMGALVGATFAVGTPPEEIEREVLAINWGETVGNLGARDRMPIQRKIAGITYTNNIEFGLKDGEIRGQGGLLNTQGIEEVLRSLAVRAAFIQNFDQLPIPFRAVATDMQAAEMVVLDSGDLPVAMRASMSVPGAFAPVVRGDQVLSDGGMMRNLPVDIARQLCADVVIAVALTSPPPRPGELRSVLALGGRSIDVMIDANQKAQLATLTESDVRIIVPMGDIGSADFEKVPQAIPLGRAAAEAQRAALARYSLPEAEYLAWRTVVSRPAVAAVRVAAVEVTGLERVNPDYVRAQLRETTPGESVTPAALDEDTARIFSLGPFEKVGYRLTGNPAEPVVEINATEKSWGPNFLRFDLGITGSSGGDVGFALYGDFRRTWMNAYGGEWRAAAQIGQESYLETSFYQPVDVRQRFFVEPGILARRNLEDVYDDGNRIAVYSVSQVSAGLDFGMNIGTAAGLRVGLDAGQYSGDVETGSNDLPQQSGINERILSLEGRYDTRNSPLLATQGSLLVAQYLESGNWLGGERSYSLAQGLAGKFFPWRGDSIGLIAAGGARLNGELPAYRDFAVGGIRTFPGLQAGQLRGEAYWQAGSAYLWKLADIQSLFGQALYAGLRLGVTRMSDRLDEVDDGTILGAAVSLGGRTPVGPGTLSLGATNNGFIELQIALGRPIWESSALDLLQ